MILAEVFDLQTTSIYESENQLMAHPASTMAHRVRFAGQLNECDFDGPYWIGVKTHDATPSDDSPALYIVRDGRSTLVSYWHFQQAWGSKSFTMEELIDGKALGGSWSEHVAAWHDRPHTLTLRYEELVADTDSQCERIAEFLNVEPKNEFSQPFEELNQMAPTLFRAAEDSKNIAEITPHLEMFDEFHGEAMRLLGYY
ncbi:sulfotransferase domain-containing protein [Methyloligella solikamskensis]|uniref:Sulfotransferase domain-containing protein n=1 Tax=Methyloligella solikamskensis TaxID=1177756 RepID=A0ABW3JAD2_9HYPH